MVFEKNRYLAWDHNEPLKGSQDFPSLQQEMGSVATERNAVITIVEYAPGNSTPLGQTQVRP